MAKRAGGMGEVFAESEQGATVDRMRKVFRIPTNKYSSIHIQKTKHYIRNVLMRGILNTEYLLVGCLNTSP